MNEIKLVQEIGNLICEDCGTGSDCGIEPEECDRIQEAMTLIHDNYGQLN